jgi:Fe-S cluster biogenesis protein NfuA
VSAETEDPRTAAIRVEALIAELGASRDARVKAAADDLVRQLMRLYGAGLERLLDLVYEQDEAAAPALFDRLADDPLVSSLLTLHGLHPYAVDRRITRAIDRVRPIVDAAGGQLALTSVTREAITVRLSVAPGLSSTAVNLRPLIERALAEAAPEIPRIEVHGLAAPLPLIQITR